ncbi:nuclear transport factor 2 family protein [Phenylobacterium sp. LjRoot225]|uniref:nuclear transport factor 2 family protein n=1 Tax=Phenylobacterium sp. LjRoot225 TaxID=3342285 RepID=UPI003ED0D4E3
MARATTDNTFLERASEMTIAWLSCPKTRTSIVAGLLLALALAPAAHAASHDRGRVAAAAPGPGQNKTGDAETQSAMAFLASVGRLDFTGAETLLAEDAVLELPYAGAGHVVSGRSQVLNFFRQTMTGKVRHIEYRLDQAYTGRTPGVIALEVSTTVQTVPDGTAVNRLVAIFRFRQGKITLFREYFNPAPVSGGDGARR